MTCKLRENRKCDPKVGLSKYEFYNKLLVRVTFFRVTSSVTSIQPHISTLDVNFDKSTVGLHYLPIFFMLIKFHGDQRLIAMSSINCLNSSSRSLKQGMKDEFNDQRVNYLRLARKLTGRLRANRKCDPTVGFSKYQFNNKLLVRVTFFRVTSSVT